MARDYIRSVTDMERYYYGAGNAMGYSYSGSELLKADSTYAVDSTAGTYQAIYGRKGLVPIEPRVQCIFNSTKATVGTQWMASHHCSDLRSLLVAVLQKTQPYRTRPSLPSNTLPQSRRLWFTPST